MYLNYANIRKISSIFNVTLLTLPLVQLTENHVSSSRGCSLATPLFNRVLGEIAINYSLLTSAFVRDHCRYIDWKIKETIKLRKTAIQSLTISCLSRQLCKTSKKCLIA